MDYTIKSALEFMNRYPEYGPGKFLAAWGEPRVFGVPDGEEKKFFKGLGFKPREFLPMGGPEAIKRYLTRPDGTILGAPPPGTPRPQIPPEVQAAAAAFSKTGFSTLVELMVP